MIVAEFKYFGYQISSFKMEHIGGAWRHQPPYLPICTCIYDCSNDFLSIDVQFRCILLFKWDGPIYLGIKNTRGRLTVHPSSRSVAMSKL